MIKVYKTFRDFEFPIEDGTVYIFDRKHYDTNAHFRYSVDIAGERVVAHFLKLEDAKDYAEYLSNKLKAKGLGA